MVAARCWRSSGQARRELAPNKVQLVETKKGHMYTSAKE
jgi:hypothetical protein